MAAVLAVVEAATEADGVRPLNEHVHAPPALRRRRRGPAPLLLYVGDDLAGLRARGPHRRRRGPQRRTGDPPGLPAPRPRRARCCGPCSARTGGQPAAVGARRPPRRGTARRRRPASTGARSLWQMRRSLSAPIPARELPEGVRLRTFEPGQDEEAWLALNARGLRPPPRAGRVDAGRPQAPRAGAVVRPGGLLPRRPRRPARRLPLDQGPRRRRARHEPIGEVYVVGVDPAEQGTGLGRALTLAGPDPPARRAASPR